MKYYVVKNGIQSGIYTDFENAKKQISKSKKTFIKKFNSLEKAKDFFKTNYYVFVEENNIQLLKKNELKNKKGRIEKFPTLEMATNFFNFFKFYVVIDYKKKYKVFNNLEKAKKYSIKNYPSIIRSLKGKTNLDNFILKLNNNNCIAPETFTAYVDGSYNPLTNYYGYGVVFCYQNEVQQFFKKFNDKFSEFHNVSGEIRGAMYAIKKAIQLNFKEMNLVYDFDGIKDYYERNCKIQNSIAEFYADFGKKTKKCIKINFIKIKGHSGNKYHNMADKLSKKAVQNI